MIEAVKKEQSVWKDKFKRMKAHITEQEHLQKRSAEFVSKKCTENFEKQHQQFLEVSKEFQFIKNDKGTVEAELKAQGQHLINLQKDVLFNNREMLRFNQKTQELIDRLTETVKTAEENRM